MNRREALKNISLGIGYVISSSALVSTIESCSDPKPGWTPVFFTDGDQMLIDHLVDIILPASRLPGGLELNLPQFVDKMCNDLLNEVDKEWVSQGRKGFAGSLEEAGGNSLEVVGKKDVKKAFSRYFDLPPGQQEKVLARQRSGAEDISEEERDDYAIYRFLFTVREFALLGYFTSERIGKEVLVFDPIPGGYKPCIPVSDVGNAWTI